MSAALGARAQLHEVPGAGHFAFLVPCGLFGPPHLCRDADGFNRKRFHTEMNGAVAEFFQKELKIPVVPHLPALRTPHR